MPKTSFELAAIPTTAWRKANRSRTRPGRICAALGAEKGDLAHVGCCFHKPVRFSFPAAPILVYGVNTLLSGLCSKPRLARMGTLSLATQISGADDTSVATAPQSTPTSGPSCLARSPGEFSLEARLGTARALPDPAICRARTARLAGYADCLVEQPTECRHALSFGFGFFCRHPERDEIVMRTSARAR